MKVFDFYFPISIGKSIGVQNLINFPEYTNKKNLEILKTNEMGKSVSTKYFKILLCIRRECA